MSYIGIEDVFFDSADHFSAQDSSVKTGVQLWKNELISVKERRHSFFNEMGFLFEDFNTSFESNKDDGPKEKEMGFSSSSSMSSNSNSGSSSCSSSFIHCDEGGNGNVDCSITHDEWEDDTEIDIDALPSMNLGQEQRVLKSSNKRIRHWLKEIMSKRIRRCKCEAFDKEEEPTKKLEIMSRIKAQVYKKSFKELSAMFTTQEIRAHKGIIRAMKFSSNGEYLASGGQDGVVRIWHVKSIDSSYFETFGVYEREKKDEAQDVIIPNRMFKLEEQPLHEFYGHHGDVLDLAWSNANYLLSASMDKTVRLWKVGSEECLNIFHHTNHVTCVQFNPINNNSFISGSVDGKVRVWGVQRGRVLDWVDVGDAVTACCYQPDGQGFVVGSLQGRCRFYEVKDGLLELSANVLVHRKRKSSTNKITAIQFSLEDSRKVMVTCEDSKLRIIDKMDVICTYRGLSNSRRQMCASFTSNGKHIISVGHDRVCIWNHGHSYSLSSSNPKRYIHSCENFYVEGLSVAVPMPQSNTLIETKLKVSSVKHEDKSASKLRRLSSFSLSNIFSCRSSVTWPEDMICESNVIQSEGQAVNHVVLPPSWGLGIVTGNKDGMLHIFHNFGLPVRV